MALPRVKRCSKRAKHLFRDGSPALQALLHIHARWTDRRAGGEPPPNQPTAIRFPGRGALALQSPEEKADARGISPYAIKSSQQPKTHRSQRSIQTPVAGHASPKTPTRQPKLQGRERHRGIGQPPCPDRGTCAAPHMYASCTTSTTSLGLAATESLGERMSRGAPQGQWRLTSPGAHQKPLVRATKNYDTGVLSRRRIAPPFAVGRPRRSGTTSTPW